jgi:hypothetical protein
MISASLAIIHLLEVFNKVLAEYDIDSTADYACHALSCRGWEHAILLQSFLIGKICSSPNFVSGKQSTIHDAKILTMLLEMADRENSEIHNNSFKELRVSVTVSAIRFSCP